MRKLISEESHLDVSHPEDLVSSLDRCYHMRCQWDIALMERIAEIDRRKIYESYGLESTASWVATRYGMGYSKSMELVDVAVAIRELPKLKEAYREARISYDHLRALVRVANDENEEDLLRQAEGLSAGATFRMVRKMLEISLEDSRYARADRWLEKYWDLEQRILYFCGQLPEDLGAKFERAIDEIARALPSKSLEDDSRVPMGVRRADALCALADSELQSSSSQPQLLVHVNGEVLSSGKGTAEIQGGPAISAETARRLSCDCSIQVLVEKADGTPIALTRNKRSVPAWLDAAVRHRAGNCCEVPGCTRRINLIRHHIRHVEHDGETCYENILLVCDHHHWMAHEGGYEVIGKPPRIWLKKPGMPPIKVGPPRATQEIIAAFDQEFAATASVMARGP
ncbi:MAG: HNH endonuclease [Actinobacteria bacterium]|nr:HNH endonuclease [Actinomycetota bacterium]